jgi:hypothetical protein
VPVVPLFAWKRANGESLGRVWHLWGVWEHLMLLLVSLEAEDGECMSLEWHDHRVSARLSENESN